MKLFFSRGNSKLDKLEKLTGKQVWSFSLLSGHTCPYAKNCLSKAIKTSDGMKIVDGPHTDYRCYSASQEVSFPPVYQTRNKNGNIILPLAAKNPEYAAKLISEELPKSAGIIRIHVGGDFKTKNYFQAWLMVAWANPTKLFYAYTKSLPFWVWARVNKLIPNNFLLTASYGGWKDNLISQYNLRYSKVVESTYRARKLKLPIDNDDRHAALPEYAGQNFALIVHGVQPAKTKWSKAIFRRRK